METISKEFAEAFVAAQGEMENPTKGHKVTVKTQGGGSYTYTYAGLDPTMACVKAALHAHGIAVAQPPVTSDAGLVGIRTELIFRTGEVWDRGTLLMKVSDDPQQVGSALTYLRRYGLTSSVGIVAEDDDDGRGAQDPPPKTPKKKTPPKKAAPAPSKAKRRTTTQHLASIADLFKLFGEAYGAERARDEMIGATEFERDGVMVPGFDSLESFRDWLNENKPFSRVAERVRVICHKIEAAYKKALKDQS